VSSLLFPLQPVSTLFPYTTLFRSQMLTFLRQQNARAVVPASTEFNRCWFPYAYQSNQQSVRWLLANEKPQQPFLADYIAANRQRDRKSTRLNSSHVKISYAVFCLK